MKLHYGNQCPQILSSVKWPWGGVGVAEVIPGQMCCHSYMV